LEGVYFPFFSCPFLLFLFPPHSSPLCSEGGDAVLRKRCVST
jgi:hypothetical protein